MMSDLKWEKRRGVITGTGSHRTLRLWSAGRVCAGPRPRMEGIQPKGCRGSHLHTKTQPLSEWREGARGGGGEKHTDKELTTCPDVYRFTVRLLPQHLRRQVAGSPCKACTHKHTHTQTHTNTHKHISFLHAFPKKHFVGDKAHGCRRRQHHSFQEVLKNNKCLRSSENS